MSRPGYIDWHGWEPDGYSVRRSYRRAARDGDIRIVARLLDPHEGEGWYWTVFVPWGMTLVATGGCAALDEAKAVSIATLALEV